MSIESPSRERRAQTDRLAFRNADGRETKISLKNAEVIGSGMNGIVYRAKIDVHGNGERTRERDCILKVFKERNDGRGIRNPRERAQHSFEVHTALKKAGVETWPTFRLHVSEPIALMSDVEDENTKIVSACAGNVSQSLNEVNTWPTFEFANAYRAMENSVRNIQNASKHGISLHRDCFMTKLSRESANKVAMQHFIADFDNVTIPENAEHTTDRQYLAALAGNMLALRHSIEMLREHMTHVRSESSDALLDGLDRALIPCQHEISDWVENEMARLMKSEKRDSDTERAQRIARMVPTYAAMSDNDLLTFFIKNTDTESERAIAMAHALDRKFYGIREV